MPKPQVIMINREQLRLSIIKWLSLVEIQATRVLTLTSSFAELAEDDPKSILLDALPEIEYPQPSFPLLAHLFDTGRANSALAYSSLFKNAIFEDPYHRDASANPETHLSLARESCIMESSTPGQSYIAIAQPLIDYIKRYKMSEAHLAKINIIKESFFLPSIGAERDFYFLSVPTPLVDITLCELAKIGALPNRDKQLLLLGSRTEKPREIREQTIAALSMLVSSEQALDKHLRLLEPPHQHRRELIKRLKSLNAHYSHKDGHEQRKLYLNLLLKIITNLDLEDSRAITPSQRWQYQLAHGRMLELLEEVEDMLYPCFLRIIDACLDEGLMLYPIQYDSKLHKPDAAMQANRLRGFIRNMVGVTPEMATFRSSAMQALSNALELSVDLIARKEQNQALTLFAEASIYFEWHQSIVQFFNVPVEDGETALSLFTNAQGHTKEYPYSNQMIYDVYVAQFISNLQLNDGQIHKVDVNGFVNRQLHIRRQQNCLSSRPLMVILDNTMCPFDAPYLPAFLNRFNKAIKAGHMCVLVAHSGNKYLHLGTDKALAALLYGYFNPKAFIPIASRINLELSENRLGDFNPYDPTILLTLGFLEQGQRLLLHYDRLIRQRCDGIFKLVPFSLMHKKNFIRAHVPFLHIPERACFLKRWDEKVNAGFISFQIQSQPFLIMPRYFNIFLQMIDTLLSNHGIKLREGFGFNLTTYTAISNYVGEHESDVFFRISIGTEDFQALKNAMRQLCDLFDKINRIMQALLKEANLDLTDQAWERKQFNCMKSITTIIKQVETQRAMMLEDQPTHAPMLMP